MKTARLIALVTALLLLLSGCAAGPETEKTQRQPQKTLYNSLEI